MKRVLLTLLAAVLTLSACAGKDAVDQGAGGTFKFGSATPLGKLYPQGERKKANDFTGPLLDGGKISLAGLKNKVVLLNFWASWCAPCRTESPQFDLLYRQLKTKPVQFVGIDTKDIKSSAKSFVAQNHISYPNVYDEQGETALRLGNLPATSLPFTVLVDKQGRVAAVYVVRLSVNDLKPAIDELLAGR
jgi:peroxiredoxin